MLADLRCELNYSIPVVNSDKFKNFLVKMCLQTKMQLRKIIGIKGPIRKFKKELAVLSLSLD
jgi:hypothetical protein